MDRQKNNNFILVIITAALAVVVVAQYMEARADLAAARESYEQRQQEGRGL